MCPQTYVCMCPLTYLKSLNALTFRDLDIPNSSTPEPSMSLCLDKTWTFVGNRVMTFLLNFNSFGLYYVMKTSKRGQKRWSACLAYSWALFYSSTGSLSTTKCFPGGPWALLNGLSNSWHIRVQVMLHPWTMHTLYALHYPKTSSWSKASWKMCGVQPLPKERKQKTSVILWIEFPIFELEGIYGFVQLTLFCRWEVKICSSEDEMLVQSDFRVRSDFR